MKFKIGYLIVILASIFSFSSCGDSCVAESLEETIIGEWRLTVAEKSGEVEFLAGGGLSDPDGILIDVVVGGTELDEKSYIVNGNNSVTVIAAKGDNSIDDDLDVETFECNKVFFNLEIDQAVQTVEMKRI